MKLTVALALVISLGGCGADDVVDGPFIDGWDLTDDRLILEVFDHPGTAEASCVIYPLGQNGLDISLDSVDDLLPETA